MSSGDRAESATAAPTESCAVVSAEPGSAPSAPPARCAAQIELNTEPTTATPRVPPSSRVASLTADPTPARAGGSTSRIDSVAGLEISPMPSPMRTICTTITGAYGTSAGLPAIQVKAAPNSTIPVVTTARVPILGARRVPTTDATAIEIATGRIRSPVERVP